MIYSHGDAFNRVTFYTMERLGSSTSAMRTKRGDWLSSGKPNVFLKLLAGVAIFAVVSAVTYLSILFVNKTMIRASMTSAQAATYHNMAKNDSISNCSYEFIPLSII